MDTIKELLTSQEGLLVKIIAVMLAVNVFLTGLKKAIDFFKDKTETTFDNKVSEIIGTILGLLSKGIGLLTSNTAVLPDKAKAELEKKD
jgi:hypothetical protein